MTDIRVIVSAYACEPNTGSETGIGWNIVREVARTEGIDVTVITRVNNREAIEDELRKNPAERLRFVYYDLPPWAGWWKRGSRGLQLYYYLWQIGAGRHARRLHRENPFHCSHHVTFGRYWSPSFLPTLGIPFFWGPIGGGESFPRNYLKTFSARDRIFESVRSAARWLGEHDPAVRRAGKDCAVAFAATNDTKDRLPRLGVKRSELLGNAALSRSEHQLLASTPPPPPGPVRFMSAGRLLHWKGFDLGLRAIATAGLRDAEYWILGDGPFRSSLESLANELGIDSQVRFFGNVPRDQVVECLNMSHVLVHPSLHDSGGWSCIEAMAAGRPVICLDLGGPAMMVDGESGFKIGPGSPEKAVDGIADAMLALSGDRELLHRMGCAASVRVRDVFSWEAKAKEIVTAYRSVLRSHTSDMVPVRI